jgi:predicted O-linked N-acetylglucosamine transferase (SPINDLY family)
LGEAADCLGRALAQDPNDLGALLTKGQIVSNTPRLQEAVDLLERALAVAPDHMKVLVTLLRLYQRLCRWEDYTALVPRLDALEAAYDEGRPGDVEPPLFHITRCDDPARNLVNARRASAAVERRAGPLLPAVETTRRQRTGPLRIGYLSRDYRDHPVGHLVRGLFAAHDRASCAVTAYSYGPDDASPYRRAAEDDSDGFRDIAGLSHRAAAELIRRDGIDILVDLAGHTNLSRLEVCALRPAPLQATYLGFPGGSGAGFFDYLIGDPVVTPPEAAADFREALAILPHAYQVNDRDQVVADMPADRAAAGLPEAGFVFACFNQPFKFDAEVFACWMGLLREVPGSLLWLFDETDGLLAARLRAEAAAAGVEGGRLVFAPRVPKAQHLARLAFADLMLDTRLYNGHTTTSDALFAGLPVVTLKGRHFASRVSASLLQAIGLAELITRSLADYQALARRLASEPGALAELRGRLAANRLTMPLFDTALTARHLEAAYREMWAIHAAGEAPRQILVPAEAAA